MLKRNGWTLILLIPLLWACAEDSEPVSIDATGAIDGLAYLDLNGTGTLETQDGPMADLRVDLRWPGSSDVVTTAASNGSGVFLMTPDVGRYELRVQTGLLGDSLVLVEQPDTPFTVMNGDTVIATVGVSYPHVAASGLDTVPVGRFVFVDGVALNAWAAYGDSTLHVADSSGAIRALRVQPTAVSAGDSVRLRGRTAVRNSRAVLDNVSAFFVQGVALPVPDTVNTAAAASAGGGSLDATLVHAADAAIVDTATLTTGDVLFRLDDGSGPLNMVLDRNIPFQLFFAGDPLTYSVNATGLLVPGTGGWTLKPRSPGDLELVAPPDTTATTTSGVRDRG